MASPRWGYLHRNSSKHTSTNMATARAPSHRASGAMIRPISFALCVDNFGIKYVGQEHAKHLASVLNEHYKCKLEWEGQQYPGMDIDWDYALSTSPCLNMYPKPKHSRNFKTHLRASRNISCTPTSSQIMAPKRSSQKTLTLPRSLTKQAKNTSKKSSALSCITLAVSTAPCYLDLVLLHRNNPICWNPRRRVHT